MVIKIILYLTFILHLFCYTHIVGQEITINLLGSTNKALLFELEGVKANKIDSMTSGNGIFHFSLNEKHIGFYRLKFDHNKWIDFVNDGKDVELKTNENNILCFNRECQIYYRPNSFEFKLTAINPIEIAISVVTT